MPIRAVLFDLGGTLLDNTDPIGWAAAAAAVGIEVDPDHLAHAAREVEAELDGPQRPTLEALWERILERATGAPVPVGAGAEFLRQVRAEDRPMAPFSDARYCLETLQGEGRLLGVVSNSTSESEVRRHLERAGLLRFFAVVVSSATEGVRKPDAEIFRRAVRRLGLPAEEVLFVGDLAFTDARAAERAGLHGLWLNRYGWGFGEEPPEVTSLTEVPGYARSIGGRSR